MNILSHIARPFFWRPKGCVPSLEALEPSGEDVRSKKELALAAGEPDGRQHPLTVVELAGGKIIGDLRLVVTANDIVIGGLQSLYGCPDPQNHYLVQKPRFRIRRHWRGTAWLLGAPTNANYFHWMLESLPRWKMIEAAGWRNYDFVLLHGRAIAFQHEMLDRLGVPPEKRLYCSKRCVHEFERLIVPSAPVPHPLEKMPRWICAWMRTLFPKETPGPEKVYLWRGPGARRLVNEEELKTTLEGMGFVSIRPGQLSVAEQAKFLSSARWIVAPHGAALANMIFAPPGAEVLELLHPQHKNRIIETLAPACGHGYAGLDGRSTRDPGDKIMEYVIDIPSVVQRIAGHR